MFPALSTITVFELAGGSINIDPIKHRRVVTDGRDKTEGVGVEVRVWVGDIEAGEGVGGSGARRWSGCSLWNDPEL